MSVPEAHSMRVALVEAPFGPAAWPSIGTSLLKTRLREAGLTVDVRDPAGGSPALAEDEIAILSDPAQHGPSMISVLVKV